MIIMIKSSGTKILETLPKPASRSRWEIDQTNPQPISIAIAIIGINVRSPVGELETCRREVLKNVLGSAPQPLKKLNMTYIPSQPRMAE